jgi:hypothetical protein
MRARLVLLVAVSLLLAPAAASGDGGPSPGAITGWDGIVAASGNIRYVALPAGPYTTVAEIDVSDGRVLRYSPVRGWFGIPLVAYDGTTGGLSADGRELVLAPFTGPPSASTVSRFAIVAVKTLRVHRWVTLRGSYSFDAISPDASTLYLIQYLSSKQWTTYRVRAFDVASGRLVPGSIVDRREPGEKMQGAPMTRATTRDGGWAYTLYARASGKPFVHALDTRHRTAFCVDLPWHADQGALASVRMQARGGKIVLRQPAIGRLATIDAHTFHVTALHRPVAPGTPVR